MKPTIGRIVIFHFTETDKNFNNGQVDAPAVITAVWSDICVNLKILCDGPFDLWKTSITEGTDAYHWSWPVKV